MDVFTTDRPEDEPRDSAARPALRLLYTKAEGVVDSAPFFLREPGVTIGRAVGPEGICLARDSQVSRLHATVDISGRRPPRLVDAGSSNGTFVNGRRVTESWLHDGDLIRVGNSFLLFRDGPLQELDAPVASIVGCSPAVRALRREVGLIGPSLATVLLEGESGTGKEITARALHQASGLRGPFVAVNCSAIPEGLAESQLFGHVAGAFTGAQPQPGWFRAAHGGTLFLDEVGELPLALQPKLLRALEEQAVTPVGSVTPVPCKVRLIAATNRDLRAAVEQGRVRGDLYARLAEIILRLPPLRERREDILPLLQGALAANAPALSPELVGALLLYPWPYNVRELLKVATELRVRGSGLKVLGLDLVAERLRVDAARPEAAPPRPPPEQPAPDRETLVALLRAHRGVVSAVARAVGRSRAQVYRLLAQHQLDAESFRVQP
jgi:DNA-binding NtrC family response regulator